MKKDGPSWVHLEPLTGLHDIPKSVSRFFAWANNPSKSVGKYLQAE
jgi:hypothetical protein